jgi:galactokinase/mevalonate kinase-like predicted kinase
VNKNPLGEPLSVFAPARVDLSPGFTDVEPFCSEMPGRVVNVALDMGVEVTICGQAAVGPASSFPDRLCAAVARQLAITRPAVRVSTPALPTGGGLGMSGALSVALAYGLSLRASASTEPADLVKLACNAERGVGLTGGTQDQLASIYGGAGLVQRHRDLGRRSPINADLPALGAGLVLVHGSGSRNSGSIIEQVLDKRPHVTTMKIIAAMNRVGEMLARSLESGDHDQLANLMNESTALLRDLHADIVSDEVVRWLLQLGAVAAKPCGAGGPGAVYAALVDSAAQPAFAAGVRAEEWSTLRAAPSPAGAMLCQPGSSGT